MFTLQTLLHYLAWPVLFFGAGGAVIALTAYSAGLLPLIWVLLGAIGFSFLTERIIPYQKAWNNSHNDALRDWAHALVNLTLSRSAVYLLPLFSWMAFGGSYWPQAWPFALQVILAVVIMDAGIAAAHHASHKFAILWRFHAVHHSVKRLYGFNGLMKHPVHQSIETVTGVLPLLLLGIPFEVALTLPFLVAITLLGQHSNADIRTGWLKYLFANAEVHRFHHSNGPVGNVNFGLFTNLYDHLMGTFYYVHGNAPSDSTKIGIRGDSTYPDGYLAQLAKPFQRQ
jgi:sterol desaturase/sphingolipid hydroxylase (fatty acid hydroxylase superfamily)